MDPSLAHLISWSEATKGDAPLPLTGPSITISPLSAPHAPTVFLFGGKYVHNRKLTNEMWAMNLNTRVWEKLDAVSGPGPRYFHSMDVWEDKLVCFGGMSDSDPTSVHNDIWFFDCARRKWMPPLETDLYPEDPGLDPMARYAHLSAVSRGQLLISGGQHSDNSWIYEVNVYDLKARRWISKTQQPEINGLHSKGAYRSVAISSKQRVITRSNQSEKAAKQTYSIEEEGEGGDIWCYSNYDFAKVRRELDVIVPTEDGGQSSNHRFTSPPSFSVRDESGKMHGTAMPPGLRFPTGGIVGNHFILCGLYLASSSAAFSVWSLDLTTLTWRHIEPPVLAEGSWNRALIWPERAKILVFGNLESDLSSDYGKRAVSVDHMAVISLETYGIYRPPKLVIPLSVQERGLVALDENLASDFEVIAEDGRRIKCSRHVLRERWSWFAAQEKELVATMAGEIKDAPAVDIADTLMGSFEPTKMAASSFTLHEPFPVCVALVQYFYTQSLSTPLQNRAPVLSALLFLAKQYKIDRLARLVVHALHERLEPNVAVGVYEIATLSGEQALQIRALNMVHSSKSASRGHRSRPSGNQGSDGGRSQSPAPGSGKPHGQGAQPGSGGAPHGPDVSQRRPDDSSHRRARVESMTLGDPMVAEADQLLNALQPPLDSPDAQDVSAPRRPIRRLNPPLTDRPPALYRSNTVTSDHRSITASPLLPYLSPTDTPSVDSASTSGPVTPELQVNALRGSTDSISLSSRAASATEPIYGLGLPSIPQEPNEFTWSFRDDEADPKADPRRPTRSASMSRPPAAPSGYQAQFIARRRDQPHTDLKVDRVSADARSSYSGVSDAGHSEWTPVTPSTPVWGEALTVQLENSSRSSRISSLMTSETASVSSGSTGKSDKKAMKEERKLIKEAEKAAQKAEQQAKFEALKAQQAADRAEAQRKAESVKFEQPKKSKDEPKSKLGKFGKKFTSAVLFPEGGSDSNYF